MQNVSVAFKMLTKVKTKLLQSFYRIMYTKSTKHTKVSIELWPSSFFFFVKTFNKNRQAKL